MSRSGLRLEGLASLNAAFAAAAARALAAATEAVRQEVDEIQHDARQEAPVDSGELRDKIVSSAQGIRGEVRSTARHAGFMEHGTYKDEARPHMAPAAERSRKRFPLRAGAVIRTALGRR